jgi:hypothetical protein
MRRLEQRDIPCSLSGFPRVTCGDIGMLGYRSTLNEDSQLAGLAGTSVLECLVIIL